MADKRKAPEQEVLGAPMYMLSFGDMMTNLLCFFILLCAFAEERRMGFISDGVGAFRQALMSHGLPGVLEADTLPVDLGASRVLFRPAKALLPKMLVDKDGTIGDGNRDALRNVVSEALKKEATSELPLSLVFMPGSADLTDAHRTALRELAPRLAGGNFTIRAQGYAWREGRGSPTEEWEMAFDRALNVVRFIGKAGGIEDSRLVPMGFGPPPEESRGGETQMRWGRRAVVLSLVQPR